MRTHMRASLRGVGYVLQLTLGLMAMQGTNDRQIQRNKPDKPAQSLHLPLSVQSVNGTE